MRLVIFILALFVSTVTNAVVNDVPMAVSVNKVQDNLQHYIHKTPDNWPRYGGAYGFGYPYKTRPQAMQSDAGVTYYVHSSCVEPDGVKPYVVAKVSDSLGNTTVLARNTYEFCDPHDNSSVYVDSDGYIHVLKASRGKFRIGYEFKSVRPNDISEFERLEDHWMSYPKMHANGTVYTDYNGHLRENWVKNSQCHKQLTRGGSYAISTEHNGEIHMVYSYHFDGNLNQRMNLYYMWSPNGCDWFNQYGEALTLPVAPNSNETAIFRDYHNFTYLKDIKFVDGEIQALITIANSAEPITGDRHLYLFKMDGSKKKMFTMKHNYDGAQFWGEDIIITAGGEYAYPGGDFVLFDLNSMYKGTYRGIGAANYPVEIKNGTGLMFGDTESSSKKSEASLYLMERN